MKYVVLVMLVLCWPAVAFTQTFHEPPRYQFGRHNEIYYGGTGVAPESARSLPARPATIRTQIFSDYFPLFREVGRFGFSIDDVRNEAYANVPRFYTMSLPP
ncbi:MAG: hypothetical protein FWD53_07720, partial [Phycisphaerales bacterium]|nr:hypothetical protein [Phycisphaerales bacterium]